MKEAVIKFEPFVFKQTIFIRDDNTGEVERKDIPQKEIASYLSFVNDINKIHFFGNEKFAEKIKKEFLTKYKMEKVEILINK